MKVFKIYSDYEIGQEYFVFKTPELAKEWAEKTLVECELESGYDEYWKDGSIDIVEVYFIEN